MENLGKHLSLILESSKNETVKSKVNSILETIEKDGIKGDIVEYIKENLSGFKDDESVQNFIRFSEVMDRIENLGVRKSIDEIKSTSLYSKDNALQGVIKNTENYLNDGAKEYVILEDFVAALEPFLWNKSILESVSNLQSSLDRDYTYFLVANAINEIRNMPDSYYYDDLINSLTTSFSLPASHVKRYVFGVVESWLEVKAVRDLVQELKLVKSRSMSQDVNHLASIRRGFDSASTFMTPQSQEADAIVFAVGPDVYERKYGIIAHKCKVSEMKDEVFCNMHSIFSNAVVENKKLTFKEDKFKIEINPFSKEVKVNEKLIKPNSLESDLRLYGMNESAIYDIQYFMQHIGYIKNLPDTALLENKEGKKILLSKTSTGTYVLTDNGFDSNFIKMNRNIREMIEEEYEVSLDSYQEIFEDNEIKDAEKQAEIDAVNQQITEVEESIEKIEILEPEDKNAPDIQSMYGELLELKKELEEKKKFLTGEEKDADGAEPGVDVEKNKEVVEAVKGLIKSCTDAGDGEIVKGKEIAVTNDFSIKPIAECEDIGGDKKLHVYLEVCNADKKKIKEVLESMDEDIVYDAVKLTTVDNFEPSNVDIALKVESILSELGKGFSTINEAEVKVDASIDWNQETVPDGMVEFQPDSPEYLLLNDMSEEEWGKYVEYMGGKGITVEYDSVDDKFIVKSSVGECKVNEQSGWDDVDVDQLAVLFMTDVPLKSGKPQFDELYDWILGYGESHGIEGMEVIPEQMGEQLEAILIKNGYNLSESKIDEQVYTGISFAVDKQSLSDIGYADGEDYASKDCIADVTQMMDDVITGEKIKDIKIKNVKYDKEYEDFVYYTLDMEGDKANVSKIVGPDKVFYTTEVINEQNDDDYFELTDGEVTVSFYKDGGKWHEDQVIDGKAPYGWGSKTYMGYLTPDEISSWLTTDYGGKWNVVEEGEIDEAVPSYGTKKKGGLLGKLTKAIKTEAGRNTGVFDDEQGAGAGTPMLYDLQSIVGDYVNQYKSGGEDTIFYDLKLALASEIRKYSDEIRGSLGEVAAAEHETIITNIEGANNMDELLSILNILYSWAAKYNVKIGELNMVDDEPDIQNVQEQDLNISPLIDFGPSDFINGNTLAFDITSEEYAAFKAFSESEWLEYLSYMTSKNIRISYDADRDIYVVVYSVSESKKRKKIKKSKKSKLNEKKWDLTLTGIKEIIDSFEDEDIDDPGVISKVTSAVNLEMRNHFDAIQASLGDDARMEYENFADEIMMADNAEDFDYVLSDIYDWADNNNVWIGEDGEVATGSLSDSDKQKINQFVQDNPNPSDEDFHAFVEAEGMNIKDAEAYMYTLATKQLNEADSDDFEVGDIVMLKDDWDEFVEGKDDSKAYKDWEKSIKSLEGIKMKIDYIYDESSASPGQIDLEIIGDHEEKGYFIAVFTGMIKKVASTPEHRGKKKRMSRVINEWGSKKKRQNKRINEEKLKPSSTFEIEVFNVPYEAEISGDGKLVTIENFFNQEFDDADIEMIKSVSGYGEVYAFYGESGVEINNKKNTVTLDFLEIPSYERIVQIVSEMYDKYQSLASFEFLDEERDKRLVGEGINEQVLPDEIIKFYSELDDVITDWEEYKGYYILNTENRHSRALIFDPVKSIQIYDTYNWDAAEKWIDQSGIYESKNHRRRLNEIHKMLQGGIPDEIWDQPFIQQYGQGFGWVNHEGRTPGKDETLIDLLRDEGYDDVMIAAFMVSKPGRHAGDSSDDLNFDKWTRKSAQEFKQDFDPETFTVEKLKRSNHQNSKINEGVVPEVGDKVKILIGNKNYPAYYAIVKSIKKTGQNDYDCEVDIYDASNDKMIATQTVQFDYLTVLEESKSEGILTLQVGDNTWYLSKMDSTHFKMGDDPKFGMGSFAVYHIGQHEGKPYYDDVDAWLKGEDVQSPLIYESNIPDVIVNEYGLNQIVSWEEHKGYYIVELTTSTKASEFVVFDIAESVQAYSTDSAKSAIDWIDENGLGEAKINEDQDMDDKIAEFLIDLESNGLDVQPGANDREFYVDKDADSEYILGTASIMGIKAGFDKKTGKIDIIEAVQNKKTALGLKKKISEAVILNKEEAAKSFPGYEEYPNIDITGSLRGMASQYGWNNKYTIKVGKYYYNLEGHPNASMLLNEDMTEWVGKKVKVEGKDGVITQINGNSIIIDVEGNELNLTVEDFEGENPKAIIVDLISESVQYEGMVILQVLYELQAEGLGEDPTITNIMDENAFVLIRDLSDNVSGTSSVEFKTNIEKLVKEDLMGVTYGPGKTSLGRTGISDFDNSAHLTPKGLEIVQNAYAAGNKLVGE